MSLIVLLSFLQPEEKQKDKKDTSTPPLVGYTHVSTQRQQQLLKDHCLSCKCGFTGLVT